MAFSSSGSIIVECVWVNNCVCVMVMANETYFETGYFI
jgi:hypothetical protein